MHEPKATHDRIQNIRLKNLEQQVHLLRAELQRLRENLLPPKDIIRLTSLADKLKELNDILKDLRSHYNMEIMKNQNLETNSDHGEEKTEEICPQGEYQQKEFQKLPTNTETIVENSKVNDKQIELLTDNNINIVGFHDIEAANTCSAGNDVDEEQFKVCKKLMEETKSPGSILGNYLLKLQDFRTDPELRRQRLERKEKEKLANRPAKNNGIPNEKQQDLAKTQVELPTSNLTQSDSTNNLQNSKHGNYSFNQQRKEVYRCSLPDENSVNSDSPFDILLISNNLKEVVYDIIGDIDPDIITLTVVLETDQLYHVSVSTTSNGESLACFFSTEDAIQEAKTQNLFQEFLTLFVVNAENSMAQKDRILGHSFEFIKLDV